MVAYVNRTGGTKGGLVGQRARTATYTKLIDIAAQNAVLTAAAGSTVTLGATDTLAICRIPVGCYVSNPSVKLVAVATGSGSTITFKCDTQAIITTAAITGTLSVPVMEDTAGYKYPCVAASKDLLILFSTDVPTGAKFLVSWTFEDTMLVDPSSQV